MSNVAIFTIGKTPQVVTETVFALARQRDPPWIAEEIHIVTTDIGAASLPGRLTEKGSEPGQLARLCAKLGIETPPVIVHVAELDGRRIADIHDEFEAAACGDMIHRLIARYANRPDGVLHVSLAGGRKTMTYHAGASASLAFGALDELSHVLVSPEAFEDNRHFWHPLQDGRIREKGADEDAPPSLDPGRAQVSLLAVPVHRFRFKKPGGDLASLSFAQAMEEATAAARARKLTVDCRTTEIFFADKQTRLAPKMFALMRLAAEARVRNWQGLGPEGAGDSQGGWLSYGRLIDPDEQGEPLYEHFIEFWTDALRASRRDFDAPPDDFDDVMEWRAAIEGVDPESERGRARLTKTLRESLGQTRAKLESRLRTVFGDTLGAPILPALIDDGDAPSRFGLAIDPRDIVIVPLKPSI